MSEEQLDREQVAAARAVVRRLLGAEMASKASDPFCVAVAEQRDRSRAPGFRFEARATGSPVAAVVEFTAETATGEPAGALETGRLADQPSPVPSKGDRLQAVRTSSYQALGAVYDEIERLSGSALGPGPEVLGAPQIPTLVTQVCWLNRTLRTWAGPDTLADVVTDPAVSLVDVPRRLVADAGTRNHVAIALPLFLGRNSLTGRGVLVAVIDSEVARAHPALAGRVVHRRNYTAEPWGNPHSHGTAVAGIVGANDTTNGGVAPGTIIYNYKVLAHSRLLNGDDFGGALAIQQALEDGVAVANCSWGAGPAGAGTSREARAVETAWALGMTVVKSAGNLGPGPATMTTPADAATIVVVGATDVDGSHVAPYSSRGPAGRRTGPDVLAPGGGPSGNIVCCAVGGGFGDAGWGTSYAAPHITGVLALWLEQEPALMPDQLRARLVRTVQQLHQGGPEAQGRGLLRLGPGEAGP